MEKRITIVKKEIGKMPVAIQIDNTLESKQAVVGGYIEVIRLTDGIDMYVNEEGLMLGMERNFSLIKLNTGGPEFLTNIVGTVFFSSIDEEGNGKSLTDLQLSMLNKKFVVDESFYITNI